MAIVDRSLGSMSCPHCKTGGPYNFRIEERVTLQIAQTTTEEAYPELRGSKVVYVCVSCGQEVKSRYG